MKNPFFHLGEKHTCSTCLHYQLHGLPKPPENLNIPITKKLDEIYANKPQNNEEKFIEKTIKNSEKENIKDLINSIKTQLI